MERQVTQPKRNGLELIKRNEFLTSYLLIQKDVFPGTLLTILDSGSTFHFTKRFHINISCCSQ